MGRSVMEEKYVTCPTNVKLLRALVWSVASKKWVIHKAQKSRVMLSKCGATGDYLQVLSTDHRTNEWIVTRLEVEETLLTHIRKIKLTYYGHIIRRTQCLEKDVRNTRLSRGIEDDQEDDGEMISATGGDF